MKLRVSFIVFTILMAGFHRPGQAADDSAVLYFNFDEGKGNTVQDGSPAKNDGKIQGEVKWVKGKMGSAMRVGGKGFVEVPHADNLNLTTAHTIAYWLKWDGQMASWSPFIAKTIGGGPKEDNFHTWVGKDQVWDYENQPHKQTHAVTKIPLDDKWVHLTVTHDGKKTVSFYINGEADKATNELMTTVGNKADVRVGNDGKGNNGKGNSGAGTIDELIIFQRELTAKEIKHLIEDGGTKFLSVEPQDKLPLIWGNVKSEYIITNAWQLYRLRGK